MGLTTKGPHSLLGMPPHRTPNPGHSGSDHRGSPFPLGDAPSSDAPPFSPLQACVALESAPEMRPFALPLILSARRGLQLPSSPHSHCPRRWICGQPLPSPGGCLWREGLQDQGLVLGRGLLAAAKGRRPPGWLSPHSSEKRCTRISRGLLGKTTSWGLSRRPHCQAGPHGNPGLSLGVCSHPNLPGKGCSEPCTRGLSPTAQDSSQPGLPAPTCLGTQ